MSYQLKPRGVKRLADGANIPNDTGNRDWVEYLAWVAGGGIPQPDDPAPILPDLSDLNNIDKLIKAAVLAAAAMSGRTPAQARAAFLAAWNSLP